MNSIEVIKKVLLFISETLFPTDFLTKRLENMSVEEFVEDAQGLSPSREIKGITILFEYHDKIVHHAVRALKFKGNELIARLFALVLYENILEELADKIRFEKFDSPILIPMPSSKERKSERGWNQCELVCHELALLDRDANFSLDTKSFAKNRFTESQVGKTRAERLANLLGSFSIKDKEKINGRNIILFDDVVTTGATMGEAKKTLLEEGARKVWCISLAH